MSNIHYFSNMSSKIAKRWRLSALSSSYSNLDVGVMKLRDLAKLFFFFFFKVIMTKSNFKKLVTSFQ